MWEWAAWYNFSESWECWIYYNWAKYEGENSSLWPHLRKWKMYKSILRSIQRKGKILCLYSAASFTYFFLHLIAKVSHYLIFVFVATADKKGIYRKQCKSTVEKKWITNNNVFINIYVFHVFLFATLFYIFFRIKQRK